MVIPLKHVTYLEGVHTLFHREVNGKDQKVGDETDNL